MRADATYGNRIDHLSTILFRANKSDFNREKILRFAFEADGDPRTIARSPIPLTGVFLVHVNSYTKMLSQAS